MVAKQCDKLVREAARLAVAQNLNVKIIIDDNDVTIAGHPSEYLKGYDLLKTLSGHGLKVVTVEGEIVTLDVSLLLSVMATPPAGAPVTRLTGNGVDCPGAAVMFESNVIAPSIATVTFALPVL